jgi:transcriptional regulator with XRE-family HTH domain
MVIEHSEGREEKVIKKGRGGGRHVGSTKGLPINGNKVLELRTERDWTQQYLGQQANLSKGTISNIENIPGFRISPQAFTGIARVFDVNPEQLVWNNSNAADYISRDLAKNRFPTSIRIIQQTLTSQLNQAVELQAQINESIRHMRRILNVINTQIETPTNEDVFNFDP